MKEKSFGFLSSYSFKGRLVIAIEERWKKNFIGEPTFEAVIDENGNYTLKGPIVRQHHRRIPTAAQEDVIDE